MPDCRTEMVDHCRSDPRTGDEVCDKVPRQKCDIDVETNTKMTPETKCDVVERIVCGPESCPLVEMDKECKNEVKEVIDLILKAGINMLY